MKGRRSELERFCSDEKFRNSQFLGELLEGCNAQGQGVRSREWGLFALRSTWVFAPTMDAVGETFGVFVQTHQVTLRESGRVMANVWWVSLTHRSYLEILRWIERREKDIITVSEEIVAWK